MKTFKFGDKVINPWASDNNQIKVGIFVRSLKRYYEFTDGNGKFWQVTMEAFHEKI